MCDINNVEVTEDQTNNQPETIYILQDTEMIQEDMELADVYKLQPSYIKNSTQQVVNQEVIEDRNHKETCILPDITNWQF